MKINFSKTWDEMTIQKRTEYLLENWKTCKDTNDALVLRVAATVAHHVLEQAKDVLTLAEEEVKDLELWKEERIVSFRLVTDQLRAERDEIRREWCNKEAVLWDEPTKTPQSIAKERGWDCFKESTE
jgi:hypothetical protein